MSRNTDNKMRLQIEKVYYYPQQSTRNNEPEDIAEKVKGAVRRVQVRSCREIKKPLHHLPRIDASEQLT